MTVIFGVNAWFESADDVRFAPARIEAGGTYLLVLDVSVVPYGSRSDQIATWVCGALEFEVNQALEEGRAAALNVSIEPTQAVEVQGDAQASATVSHELIAHAAALPFASADVDPWILAYNPDVEVPDDALTLLRKDPQHPVALARFVFKVHIRNLDDFELAGVCFRDPVGEELESTILAYDDTGLSLPWGAGPPREAMVMEEAGAPGDVLPAMELEEAGAARVVPDRTVTLFYGTDRKNTGSPKLHELYSNERGGFETGVIAVNIPPGHEVGEIERPMFGWHRLESTEKHVMLLSIDVLSESVFYDRMQAMVSKTNRREAFVFIHGYNVDFEAAALRTGQLAYDFQRLGVDAVPVLYSWPSIGTKAGYLVDYDTCEWSAYHLEDFLGDLRSRSGADVIHLIAHSMGNQVLTKALRRLAIRADTARFHEVVFAAPDIDAENFRRVAAEIRSMSKRMTLYANSGDKALDASEVLRLGRVRAGDVEEGRVVLAAGVDSIDASDLDTGFMGHSYFAEQHVVIRDIAKVMERSAPPSDRPWLLPRRDGDQVWWALQDE